MDASASAVVEGVSTPHACRSIESRAVGRNSPVSTPCVLESATVNEGDETHSRPESDVLETLSLEHPRGALRGTVRQATSTNIISSAPLSPSARLTVHASCAEERSQQIFPQRSRTYLDVPHRCEGRA